MNRTLQILIIAAVLAYAVWSAERSIQRLSMAAVQCSINMKDSTTTIQLGRKQ